MTHRSIHQEDIIILDVYSPNSRASKYMKQKITELQREIDKYTIIVEGFNILSSVINRTIKQKISKHTKIQKNYQLP